MCGSHCKKNNDLRPDGGVCNSGDDGEEGNCKSNEQAFVGDFVAEILSHYSLLGLVWTSNFDACNLRAGREISWAQS